jgi:prevent-host-death family protein
MSDGWRIVAGMSKSKRRRVPVRELSRHTAALLDAVAAGESIEVTRDGVPVAILSPVEPAERDIRAAIAIGLLDSSVMDESHGVEAADALERLRAVRRDAEGRAPTAELLMQREEETR